jgi:hypothetical protein
MYHFAGETYQMDAVLKSRLSNCVQLTDYQVVTDKYLQLLRFFSQD